MTSPTESRLTEPADAPAVPLDDVMLAMDVVDTLRHERQMTEDLLDGDERERGLIERIKAIYASQGIEVPDEVIAEGVEALEQDRFTYEPPERTLAVRLAEIYVARGKWGKRAAVCLAVIAGLWLAVTVPLHLNMRAQVAGFAGRLGTMVRQVDDLGGQADVLRTELLQVRAAGVSAGAAAILDGAEHQLDQLGGRVRALRGDLSPGPDPELYPDQQERLDGVIERHRESLASIASGFGSVRGQLQAASRLASMSLSVRRLVARLAGLDLEDAVAAELQSLRAGIEAAVETGDVEAARNDLARLTELVDVLDLSYELHIVSKSGEQSGVWRHPDARRSVRNYYVIVEAMAADGSIVPLPVTNEETSQTSRVDRFGIRVPEAVYEKVKADKLDNGLVDDKVFGVKKRGARDVRYRFEVAGGMITRW